MRIAVDAMGSDEHPGPDVRGSVMAARHYGLAIVLIGDEALIKPCLDQEDTAGLKIDIVHTDEYITMDDHPAEAARTKKNSPMHLGMGMVKAGEADGFVSAGNSGGTLAVATLHTLRRIRGVARPALTMPFIVRGEYIVLSDIGTNTDCKPAWLLQFALMASLYTERVLGIENPRVGLLANGEEDIKGNELTRAAADLIRKTDLNFIGNIEPKDVLLHQKADVAIHDGFAGNILIKTFGAAAELILSLMREVADRSLLVKLGLGVARPGLRSLRQQIDPMEFGGALLLGVNGVVIIAHGRSNALGIKNAIRQARDALRGDMVNMLREGIAEYAEILREDTV